MLKSSAPIFVDLGTASRKRIRKLKDGCGKLDAEVLDVLAQISAELGADAENKQLMPIVVVYSRKGKRQRSLIDRIF